MDPEVAVIIPAYRVTQYIAKTLDSVFAQTIGGYEVIVVNDGCPDTAALERILEPYLSRIVYLKQENGGPAAARNRGIHASRSRLLAFLDADDLWEPDYLAVQTAFLRDHPEVDLVYPNGRFIGDVPEAGRLTMDFSPSEGEVDFASLALMKTFVNIQLLARREAIERAGLFDPAAPLGVEDFDLWLRVAITGGRFGYHRKPLFRYRRRRGSLSADAVRLRRAGLKVLDRIGERQDLTDSDREALAEAEVLYKADIAYLEARQALANGDAGAALAGLDTANRYFQRRSLRFALFLLKWWPGLACAVYRVRQRLV